MPKIYTFIFCLHFFCSAFPQQIKLLKSTVSPGGTSIKYAGRYSLSQTIGQSSLINGFKSTSTHLLQGFQHPFFYDQSEISITNNFSVYPNPSSGKVTILWKDDVVTEQVDVSLFDLQGKLADNMLHQRDGNKVEADFTKVTSGIYELVVQGNKSGVFKALLILK